MGKATEYTRVAVDKLIPYVNNAKQHSDSQVTKIASSIREFGFLNPVLIDSKYNVIAGHGRILAAKKLQMDEVPCLFVEGLTDAQRKAYILADNRLSELGEWDMELVMGELAELDELGFDTELTGFDLSKSNNEQLAEVTKDDEDYSSIHYLVSIGVDEHDKIAPLMQKCEELGAEVHMTRNDL